MKELRKGMAIRYNGDIYFVIDFQHTHMGRGGASIRTKLKNVRTGQVFDVTFRESDEPEEVRVERRRGNFTYSTGEEYHFMDQDTYEDILFTREQLSVDMGYLKEGMELTILYAEDTPIGIELPLFVELVVKDTDPGLKGDTASGGSKPAVLETGKVIQVPLFIRPGDTIKIDTRTDRYIERV